MARWSKPRLALSLAYLVILFAVAGTIYARMQAFEGEIYLGPGIPESVVVRTGGGAFPALGIERNMPAELIHFDNPSTVALMDENQVYDAAQLPFSLRLDAVETIALHPPRAVIAITSNGDTREWPAEAGVTIETGAGHFVRLLETRPWSGLVRTPHGNPMAMIDVGVPDKGWVAGLFVSTEEWLYVQGGIGVRLRWFYSEPEARAALPTVVPGIESARWGVREGQRVHWFQSFAPGTGITLDDGAEVTLIATQEDAAGHVERIEVEITRGGSAKRHIVPARAEFSTEGLRFENPVLLPFQAHLHAWKDGEVIALAIYNGKLGEPAIVKEGETWRPGSAGSIQLRLDQLMGRAVPLAVEDSEISEALLEIDGGVRNVREGEESALGDAILKYRRIPQAPDARHTLSAIYPGGDSPDIYTMGPGETLRIGDWKFSPSSEVPASEGGAVLHARRTLGGPVKMAGAVLFMLGSFGYVIVRYLRTAQT